MHATLPETRRLDSVVIYRLSYQSSSQELSETEGYQWEVKLDEDQKVTGLWWQSRVMQVLAMRYADILINDCAANQTNTGYLLDIGIGIDGMGNSRNLWYALIESENREHHAWVLQRHLNTARKPPEVFASDRDAALISAVTHTMPLTFHLYCLHHLSGNVNQAVCAALGSQWVPFLERFWTIYCAVSPDEFERLWLPLLEDFPTASHYLQAELYPSHEHWAYAWTSSRFTAGIRTNGRCESENKTNKTFSGPKTTVLQLFNNLNGRTSQQSTNKLLHLCESSRRQHDHPIETLFPGPLKQIRQYAGPFAVQRCFAEMKESVYYQLEVLQLPEGLTSWSEYAIQVLREVGYNWEGGEETSMLNWFSNDHAYISTHFLLRLISDRGLLVRFLLRIQRIGTKAVHILAILSDGRYVCDCCMGVNLRIPCRHFFHALTRVQSLGFHIGLIRPRWLQDPELNLSDVPTVMLEHIAKSTRIEPTSLLSSSIAHPLLSNPLQDLASQVPPTHAPRPTDTLNAREVFHEAQAALRPLIQGIQTQKQLDAVLDEIQSITRDEPSFHGANALNPKGRPRTQRLTGALEGRPRGGGGRKRPLALPSNSGSKPMAKRRCGVCRSEGHNRSACPLLA